MLKYLLTQLRDLSNFFVNHSEKNMETSEFGMFRMTLTKQFPSDDDNYFDCVFLDSNFEELLSPCDCRIIINIMLARAINNDRDLHIVSYFYYRCGKLMRIFLLPHYFNSRYFQPYFNMILSESFPKSIDDIYRHCLEVCSDFDERIKLIDFEKIKLEII